MYRLLLPTSAALAALFFGSTATAQATANAVTGATDAFGFRNGDETVGIYDESSVRGFSLEAAGNYRINGTYFVRNSGVSAFFLENTTVRIGYNTLSTILPGPSGVVDYRLRDPRHEEPDAFTVGLDPFSQPYAELHLKHRSADDRSSYSIGIGRVFDLKDAQGGSGGDSLLVAGVGRFDMGRATARLLFGEYQYERAGLFRVRTDGRALPPELDRGRFLGQDWAREEGQRRIAGLLIDTDGTGSGVGGTLVFSQEDPTRAYTQVFSAPAEDGTSRASVIAVPQQRSTAWSGELRAHRAWSSGSMEHRLDLTLRGRHQYARLGGGSVIDLGLTRFGQRPQPAPSRPLDNQAAALRDEVGQWGVGLAYRAAIADRVRLNVGVLRTDYEKTFTGVDRVSQGSSTSPILYNAGASWLLTRHLEVFGSFNRGLEEAGVAPAVATNRNEVLSAITVTQRELGLRYTSASGALSAVVAGFDTDKPYAAIEPVTGAFGFLGQVRHRGVEASLSGRPLPGLTVVLGGVLIEPTLTGPAVDARLVGSRPVGVPKLRAIANVDYRIPAVQGLSVDAGAVFVGRRAASSRLNPGDARQLELGDQLTFNVGLRYAFTAGGRDLVGRIQLQNVTDQFSWEVNNSETLAYNAPRRLRVVFTTLF